MKYFIISDIHSFYDEMINSLNNHLYDSTNPNHHLLVIGDLFDRGPKAKEVLHYLYPLHSAGKCTIILGNHDLFLLQFLGGDDKRTMFNIARNGHGYTLDQLSGLETKQDNLDEVRKAILKNYHYIYEWISSFPLYLEIDQYVFVHGGIDGSKAEWKSETSIRDFVWGKEFDLPRLPNKTVVCGHTRVATIRKKTEDYEELFIKQKHLFDILKLDGKIMIDRFVEVSHELNVLILEI